jgi:chaperonin GroES
MIKPTRGYALIEPLDAEEKVDGVYLPESSKETQAKGKVLAVGAGFTERKQTTMGIIEGVLAPEFNEGDIVFHKRFVDNHIKDGDKELLLVPFGDILAIIK